MYIKVLEQTIIYSLMIDQSHVFCLNFSAHHQSSSDIRLKKNLCIFIGYDERKRGFALLKSSF